MKNNQIIKRTKAMKCKSRGKKENNTLGRQSQVAILNLSNIKNVEKFLKHFSKFSRMLIIIARISILNINETRKKYLKTHNLKFFKFFYYKSLYHTENCVFKF